MNPRRLLFKIQPCMILMGLSLKLFQLAVTCSMNKKAADRLCSHILLLYMARKSNLVLLFILKQVLFFQTQCHCKKLVTVNWHYTVSALWIAYIHSQLKQSTDRLLFFYRLCLLKTGSLVARMMTLMTWSFLLLFSKWWRVSPGFSHSTTSRRNPWLSASSARSQTQTGDKFHSYTVIIYLRFFLSKSWYFIIVQLKKSLLIPDFSDTHVLFILYISGILPLFISTIQLAITLIFSLIFQAHSHYLPQVFLKCTMVICLRYSSVRY